MSKMLTAWHNADTDEVHSPKGRLVYPTLLEPRSMKGDANSKPKFGTTLLIPKAANIDALKKLISEKASGEFGKDWQKKKLKLPMFKTADYEKLADNADEYPIFIRASANPDFPPFIFGPDAKTFTGDGSEIYSGRHAIVTVRAYGYDTAGNKGVAFGLQRVQLLDHDDAIAGGRVATASGFERFEGNVGGTEFNIGGPATADDVFDKKPAAATADFNDQIPF